MPWPVVIHAVRAYGQFSRTGLGRANTAHTLHSLSNSGGAEIENAAVQSSGAAATGATQIGGAAGRIRFTFDTRAFEKMLRKKAPQIRKTAEIAAVRAANRSGAWGVTQMRRELSKLLNVSQKSLRVAELIRKASFRGKRFTPYEVRWKRRQFPLSQIRGVRFRPASGTTRSVRFPVGTLRFTAYGKKVELDDVMRWTSTEGKVRYYKKRGKALRSSGDRKRSFSERWRKVAGTYLKKDYRGPKGIKRKVRERMSVEFLRQYRVLRRKQRGRS